MLFFSRVALLSALTATVINAQATNCVQDTSCQKMVCQVFDAACPEDKPICEQLESYPWYNCLVANEVDVEEELEVETCEKDICGTGAGCNESGMGSVYCTCDNFVIPRDQDCVEDAFKALDNCQTHGCGDGTDCHEDGLNIYCTCGEFVVPKEETCENEPFQQQQADSCQTHYCGAGTQCHEGMDVVYCTCDNRVVADGEGCETHDRACSLNCHESATCRTADGDMDFCVCEDGWITDENKPCP